MRWSLILALSVAVGIACTGSDSSATPNPPAEVNMDSSTTTPSGLQYRDLVVGTGEAARAGATAVVHYTGWLADGTEFDSSLG